MKNECVMKKMSMIVLAVAICWAGGSVTQGFIVSNGLEAYLDFTVDPGGATVIDKTGNGNNGTFVTGMDPSTGGPSVNGVPYWDGSGVRFNNGFVDLNPAVGTIGSLTSGTIEIIIDDHKIIDTQIASLNVLSVANTGNDAAGGYGREYDWEVGLDHRYNGVTKNYFSGRVNGADQLSTNTGHHGMLPADGSQREQYFVQWEGTTNQARLVGRFQSGGSLTVMSSPWATTGTMPDFLSDAINLRFGGRNYDHPDMGEHWNSGEKPYYTSVGNILRVYDRVLTDAEMLQNWNEYNAEIPEPATIGLLTLGGILGLRRRNRKQA